MDYRRLGNTGLSVSRLCLGCMSYGDPNATLPGEAMAWRWALKEDESRPFFKRALDLGINFFDTANVYSFGASEEITGRALRDLARREDVVIATKVFSPMRIGPNGGAGLPSRAPTPTQRTATRLCRQGRPLCEKRRRVPTRRVPLRQKRRRGGRRVRTGAGLVRLLLAIFGAIFGKTRFGKRKLREEKASCRVNDPHE